MIEKLDHIGIEVREDSSLISALVVVLLFLVLLSRKSFSSCLIFSGIDTETNSSDNLSEKLSISEEEGNSISRNSMILSR